MITDGCWQSRVTPRFFVLVLKFGQKMKKFVSGDSDKVNRIRHCCTSKHADFGFYLE